MADVLKHKGYLGSVEFDLEDGYLHGKVKFVNDRIIYDGQTIDELKQAFVDAVDGYLELCAEIGKTPDAPCSGTFNVRISPELHRKSQLYAYEHGITLNATVERALTQLCHNDQARNIQEIKNLTVSIHKQFEYKVHTTPFNFQPIEKSWVQPKRESYV